MLHSQTVSALLIMSLRLLLDGEKFSGFTLALDSHHLGEWGSLLWKIGYILNLLRLLFAYPSLTDCLLELLLVHSQFLLDKGAPRYCYGW